LNRSSRCGHSLYKPGTADGPNDVTWLQVALFFHVVLYSMIKMLAVLVIDSFVRRPSYITVVQAFAS